ncbi:MAG: phosphatidylglycerophosphatase [Legionella sp. 40-6]|nr:phosphatase PAP2 family protein [Legionella sp.]OJY01725.1 MAG: phosphatidylglycerophosphatase [Legionella sp. 40-6]
MTQFTQTFNFMRKPLVIMIYVILVFLAYNYVDKNLANYLYPLNLRVSTPVLVLLTMLGKWSIYVPIFLMTALFFRFVKRDKSNEWRAWYLLGAVVAVNLVCLVLKVMLSRARPELLFTTHEFGFYWVQLKGDFWSFPSGHTMTIVGVAAAVGILFPRFFYLLMTIALLVAASRVLLYYHYLSDVMTGFYLSILVIGYYTQYLQKHGDFNQQAIIM